LLLNLIVAALIAFPLGWFAYLCLFPEVNRDYAVNRYHELTRWVNVAVIPLLGFLALASHLATGDRRAAALALSALTFTAIFPMHRLFTAAANYPAFLIYETPARFLFVALFLPFSGQVPTVASAKRRRNAIAIVVVAAILMVARFSARDVLDDLDDFADTTLWVVTYKGLEAATVPLAVLAAWRLFRQPATMRLGSLLMALAFAFTAELSLFFFASHTFDWFWWSANILWGTATLLLVGSMLVTAANAGQHFAEPIGVGSCLGEYEILNLIGEGGMGQVFRALHRVMKREVALKVIRPEKVANPIAVRRLHREARAAARLSHVHIVQVYDVAEVNGVHFLVMEYVDGNDLGEVLSQRGAFPIPLACTYIRQACLALQHAHQRGLVHRDIKPSNLLLSKDGTAIKVLDLGVVLLQLPDQPDLYESKLTQTGTVMGTPAYLSPEQAFDARRVDIRADIYSLGCTLYHLLTGKAPFRGVSITELVLRHQLEEPIPIAQIRLDVPAELQAVLHKMMAKRPENRYQSPAETADALRPFCILNKAELADLWAKGAWPSLPEGASEAIGSVKKTNFTSLEKEPGSST
jgi:serine/threonine protein kinase